MYNISVLVYITIRRISRDLRARNRDRSSIYYIINLQYSYYRARDTVQRRCYSALLSRTQNYYLNIYNILQRIVPLFSSLVRIYLEQVSNRYALCRHQIRRQQQFRLEVIQTKQPLVFQQLINYLLLPLTISFSTLSQIIEVKQSLAIALNIAFSYPIPLRNITYLEY